MASKTKTRPTAMDIITTIFSEVFLFAVVALVWYVFLTEYPNTMYLVFGYAFGRLVKYIPFKRLKL